MFTMNYDYNNNNFSYENVTYDYGTEETTLHKRES
jgi:hypothetical protein